MRLQLGVIRTLCRHITKLGQDSLKPLSCLLGQLRNVAHFSSRALFLNFGTRSTHCMHRVLASSCSFPNSVRPTLRMHGPCRWRRISRVGWLAKPGCRRSRGMFAIWSWTAPNAPHLIGFRSLGLLHLFILGEAGIGRLLAPKSSAMSDGVARSARHCDGSVTVL